ncbi:MAG TPA: hypothetical protein VLE69_04295 [Candidatus Saccharimonadales bacterium]|nr:hypothetical protein [Candidatus Saccharimonadales bacterium]
MRSIVGIILVILLIFLGIILFRSPGKPKQPAVAGKTLPEYSTTDAQVRLTIDGIINSEQQHQAIKITVGKDQNSIDIIQGYQNHLLNSKVYDNNQSAYFQFLSALNLLGYTKERKTINSDMNGQCPLGSRYSYELINAGDADFDRWNTSCSNVPGTFGSPSPPTIRTLFERQIPDYAQLTQSVQGVVN